MTSSRCARSASAPTRQRRAALLHRDRRPPHVERAGREHGLGRGPRTARGSCRRCLPRSARRGAARVAPRRPRHPVARARPRRRAARSADPRARGRRRPSPTASVRPGRRGGPARHGRGRGSRRRSACTARAASPPSAITPPASRRTSSAAGAGTGSTPCALTSVPWPIATLAQLAPTGSSQASAAAVPTTSTIESIAPTSWKVTCSTVVPWSRASARASRSKISRARVRVPSVSGARRARGGRSDVRADRRRASE